MSHQKSISLEALRQILSSGQKNVRLIDIRSPEEYQKQHIPAAINIPAETIDFVNFSQEEVVICICNHGKKRSQQVAAVLYDKGYLNACYLEGGTAIWFDAESTPKIKQ